MSRTKRKIRRWKRNSDTTEIIEGGDAKVSHGWWGNRRMKPYAKTPAVHKERASKTCHVAGYSKGVSKYDKLITKNANRSRKKAYRQQLKKELQNEL